ncbi:MAG: putative ABC transporter permease subunit [Eubacteriaceae bacterium]
MKEIVNLVRLFINSSWGISLFFYNQKNNKKAFAKQLFTVIILIVGLLPLCFLYVGYMSGIYYGLSLINQTSVFLSLGYVGTTIVILFFGILYILSEFYFSKDIEILLPLPIRNRNIIIGKFLSVLLTEYLVTGIMFIPILVIYGVGQGMGIGYAFLSLCVFLCLPILPLATILIVLMLMMSLFSFRGRKDVFQVLFAVAAVAVILGIEFFFTAQMGTTGSSDLQGIISHSVASNELFLNSIGNIVPTSFFVAWGLNEITWMSMGWVGLLVGTTVLIFILMIALGEKFYFKGLNNKSGGTRNRNPWRGFKKDSDKLHRKWVAVFLMDLRVILRTPIYLFNNVSIVIIAPLCVLFSVYLGSMSGDVILNVKDLYQEFEWVLIYILIGFFLFLGATTATTSTTFSREGKNSWITRVIPTSGKDQIFGRVLTSICIQGLGIVFSLGCCAIFIPITIKAVLISGMLGILGTLPVLLFGLFIDMNRPLLNWDNPQKAVKNNLNVIITLFFGTLYSGILILISGILGYFINPWLGYLVYSLISVVLVLILYHQVNKNLEENLVLFE